MQRIRPFLLLLTLVILIAACSAPSTPEPTEMPVQPTAEETPLLGRSCNLILDHVAALGAAAGSNGETGESAPEAPVAPNATLLTGNILCQQEFNASQLGLEPERKIYAATVQIVTAEELGEQVNRLEGQEGSQVLVFSETPFILDQRTGMTELIVTYQGDEAGGAYWAVGTQFS
jgi:hypothetical protein